MAAAVSDAQEVDSAIKAASMNGEKIASESEKEVVIPKDEAREFWNKYVVPFLKGEVLPNFLCGDNNKFIYYCSEELTRSGMQNWKKEEFDVFPREMLEEKWAYGLPEQIISDELITQTLRCRCSWPGERRSCVGCRRGLVDEAIEKHEDVCRGHLHPHPDKCCSCHVKNHADVGSCFLCGKKFYSESEDYGVVRLLRCSHMFHPGCIKAFLMKKNVCPICHEKAIFRGATTTCHIQWCKAREAEADEAERERIGRYQQMSKPSWNGISTA